MDQLLALVASYLLKYFLTYLIVLVILVALPLPPQQGQIVLATPELVELEPHCPGHQPLPSAAWVGGDAADPPRTEPRIAHPRTFEASSGLADQMTDREQGRRQAALYSPPSSSRRACSSCSSASIRASSWPAPAMISCRPWIDMLIR